MPKPWERDWSQATAAAPSKKPWERDWSSAKPASSPAAASPQEDDGRIYDTMGYDPMGGFTGATDGAGSNRGYLGVASDIGTGVDNVVRAVANGMTFGIADKAAGGMDAVTGRAESYDEGVRAQRDRTQKFRDDHPVIQGAGELVGGLATGMGMARNGLTMAGRVTNGILPRMAAYGTEGAVYGAAHGAGNTYSDDWRDYAGNAWDSGKVGFGIGMALPAAGSAASALFRGGKAIAGPTIEGTGRTATALLRGGALADEMALRGIRSMGDEAMLVDAGPSMLGLGQGAGTGTGQGRSELVNALRSRDDRTGQRLAGMLDETLGPAPVPSQIREGLDASREAIGQRYNDLELTSTIVDPREFAEGLEAAAFRLRGPAQAAVQRVRGFLNQTRLPGAPVPRDANGNPVQLLASDADTLFQTRQAIDGMLAGEADPKVVRQLTMARQGVDDMLADAAPDIKRVDGQFQEIARQDEALTRGGQVFDTGKTATRPVELAQEIQEGALPAGQMVGPSGVPYRMRQGARAEVDRLVGTHVNDLNTLERTLATPQDWNSQKFAAVFGEPEYNAVADALRTNRRFRQSYQDIVQGSQTAQRTAAQKSMDGEIEIPLDATIAGTGAAGARAIYRALVGMSREATKDEIGRVLAKQGPDAARIMEALLEGAATTRAGSQAVRGSIASPAAAAGGGQIGGQRRSR